MGLFDKMKDAMGAAADAQKQAGYGEVHMGNAAQTAVAGMQDRNAIEAQAHESNRILSVGNAGKATIVSHVDTGEQLAGNAIWVLNVQVAPEGGEPYTIEKKEIVPAISASGYADGTTMDCRIDPADPNKIAFGDKPFM